MAYRKIAFLIGFDHMTSGRHKWIADYLSLFSNAIQAAVGTPPEPLILPPLPPNITSSGIGDSLCLIGHELPPQSAAYLSTSGVTFIDIRVSPLRFLAQDFVLAFGTNDTRIFSRLLRYRLSDAYFELEAKALAMSFRYRDLGQYTVSDDSAILFIEQQVDRDSIHFDEPRTLKEYQAQILDITHQHKNAYYVGRKNEQHVDATFLKELGISRIDANPYAILSCPKVSSIVGIRGGILEEARFFNKTIYALDAITTPTLRDNVATDTRYFVNISVSDALSPEFWRWLLAPTVRDRVSQWLRPHSSPPLHSTNFLRRALNIWNATASGIDLQTEAWQALVAQPINEAMAMVREEISYRAQRVRNNDNQAVAPLVGQWIWFTGDTVHIESDGFVHYQDDFGHVETMADAGKWQIFWQRRALIDYVHLQPDNHRLVGTNQYGDSITAERKVG